MKISLITATSQNLTIGANGKLPWHLPTDLAYFKKLTLNNTIIMGRKTFDSIGRPLPKRRNIVISRETPYLPKGVELAPSMEQALVMAGNGLEPDGEVFVIGGAEIYRLALPYAHKIYLSDIDIEIEGDAFFPALDPKMWYLAKEGEWLTDSPDQPRFRFLEMVKVVKDDDLSGL